MNDKIRLRIDTNGNITGIGAVQHVDDSPEEQLKKQDSPCFSIDPDLKYLLLWNTLRDAWDQAASGKGKERHQKEDESFEDQPICMFARRVGLGYPLGQAMKKIDEAARMEPEAAVRELLGAINYLAAAVIVIREQMEESE